VVEFVLLVKPKMRCCEANRVMSHLPIGQAAKTEHWLVYSSTRARSPPVRREYGFCAWTSKDYQEARFYICGCGLFFKDGPILTLQQDFSDASKIAQIYFDGVMKLHGLPKTIVSDRDVKVTSYF